MLAAVAAAVARDKAVAAELAAAQRRRFDRFGEDSDGSDDEGPAAARHGAQHSGRQHGAGAGGAPAAALDRFAGSSSEDEEGRQAGTVEFGGDYGGEDGRRAKRRKQEAGSGGAAAAGGQKKAAAVAVRRGELVHAGTGGPSGTQGQLFGAANGGASSGAGFEGAGLSMQLSAHLAAHGFAQPTRVQQQAIPVLLVRA